MAGTATVCVAISKISFRFGQGRCVVCRYAVARFLWDLNYSHPSTFVKNDLLGERNHTDSGLWEKNGALRSADMEGRFAADPTGYIVCALLSGYSSNVCAQSWRQIWNALP